MVADREAVPDRELRQSIWEQLQQAVDERGHEWRTPVLANVDADGLPQARTVVLRGVDTRERSLFVYTDHRSPKVAAIGSRPQAVLVFWSRALSWQLRVSVDLRLETNGPEVEAAWNRIQDTAAASDYLSLEAPGSPLREAAQASAGQHSLGILVARVRSMDWLELSARGHRRAMLTEDDLQWTVP